MSSGQSSSKPSKSQARRRSSTLANEGSLERRNKASHQLWRALPGGANGADSIAIQGTALEMEVTKRKVLAKHGAPSSLQDRIREYIVSLMDSGKFGPGDRLPTEQEFATELGVSLAPVRMALNQLVQSARIIRFRGRGSFVLEPPAVFKMEFSRSITVSLRDAGIDFEVEVIDQAVRRPPADVCQILNISRKAHAQYLRRLFLHRGEPIVLSSSWIVNEPGASIANRQDFATGASLYQALEEGGFTVMSARAEVDVYQSSQEVANLMDLSFGTPLLEWRTTGLLDDGRVIETSINRFNTKRLRVVIGDSVLPAPARRQRN